MFFSSQQNCRSFRKKVKQKKILEEREKIILEEHEKRPLEEKVEFNKQRLVEKKTKIGETKIDRRDNTKNSRFVENVERIIKI